MAGSVSQSVSNALQSDPLDELCSRLLQVSISNSREFGLALVENDFRTNAILDHLPELIYVKDRECRVVFANAAAHRNSAPENVETLSGMTDFDILDPTSAQAVFDVDQQVMSSGIAVVGMEERITLADGRIRWFSTSKTPLHDSDGQVVGLVGISRDITDQKRQDNLRHGHAALLEMIARAKPLQMVLDAIVSTVEAELDGVVASLLLVDEAGKKLYNGAATRLPAALVQIVEGLPISPNSGSCGTAAWRREPVLVSDVSTDSLWIDYREAALKFGFHACWSTPILSPDGSVLGTFGLYANAPRLPSELELELTVMATDIAGIAIERARNEARIHHMAHHDHLTGLPNRMLFWTQFSRALNEARREDRKVTVAYIDLDNFKQINDALGHAVGDEVLKTLSSRMVRCIRSTDLVVRLGGDEFAIMFSNPHHDESGVLRRLQELRTAISHPIEVGGHSVIATCSMGVAFYPQDGETPEALLASADHAMYLAKNGGRDRLCVSETTGF